MKKTKRLSKVEYKAATCVIRSNSAAFLTLGHDVYWVTDDSRILPNDLDEGMVFWIAIVVENGSVTAILPYKGEKAEDLPKIESVEI